MISSYNIPMPVGPGSGGADTGYADMLKKAQSQYSGILQGYQRALQGQQQRSQQINQGYNQLQANVLGNVANAGAGRSQEIADFYTQQAGRANQNLISRGLGNSTVASSVGRGLAYDQSKAQTQLSGQLSGQMAQYQSQLGLAGLGYRNQANQQNTALQGASLGYQGDWQGRMLGAGMQGAGYANQYALGAMGGRGGGGGGGYGGGGGGSGGSILDRRSGRSGGFQTDYSNMLGYGDPNQSGIDQGGSFGGSYGQGYGGVEDAADAGYFDY